MNSLYVENHLICLDLVHSNRTILHLEKYFKKDVRISASKASDPENLKNVSHPLLMFHRDVKAKSVMDGYGGGGATCGVLTKGAVQTGAEPTRLFHLQ